MQTVIGIFILIGSLLVAPASSLAVSVASAIGRKLPHNCLSPCNP